MLLYSLCILLLIWVCIEIYKLYIDGSNNRTICKQLITEIINSSSTVMELTDKVDMHRIICESLATWNTLSRLMPLYTHKYSRIHEVLLAQHEHVISFLDTASIEDNFSDS